MLPSEEGFVRESVVGIEKRMSKFYETHWKHVCATSDRDMCKWREQCLAGGTSTVPCELYQSGLKLATEEALIGYIHSHRPPGESKDRMMRGLRYIVDSHFNQKKHEHLTFE